MNDPFSCVYWRSSSKQTRAAAAALSEHPQHQKNYTKRATPHRSPTQTNQPASGAQRCRLCRHNRLKRAQPHSARPTTHLQPRLARAAFFVATSLAKRRFQKPRCLNASRHHSARSRGRVCLASSQKELACSFEARAHRRAASALSSVAASTPLAPTKEA